MKLLCREVCALSTASEPKRPLKWSHVPITFSSRDLMGDPKVDISILPLMVTPTIDNIGVARMLIDGGAALNVLSVKVFAKMQGDYSKLKATRPLTGIALEYVWPIS